MDFYERRQLCLEPCFYTGAWRTGTTVDIALPPGESLTSNPLIGDPRWRMVTFASGNVVHIALKPQTRCRKLS